jgi:hypothetical protein
MRNLTTSDATPAGAAVIEGRFDVIGERSSFCHRDAVQVIGQRETTLLRSRDPRSSAA